jgi:hypothetical protein
MAPRLGDLLIQKGLVTRGRVEEAAQAQLIHGGRLGTNLVELGHVDVWQLGQVLAEQRRFPLVTQAELDAASRSTVEVFSPDQAGRFVAFPFFRDGPKRLKVVLSSPWSMETVDQLGFVTGMRIIPYVAPELLVWAYLERHYGISQPSRSIRIAPNPAMQPHRAAEAAAPTPSAPPPRRADSPFGSLNDGQYLSSDEDDPQMAAPMPSQPSGARPPGYGPPPSQPGYPQQPQQGWGPPPQQVGMRPSPGGPPAMAPRPSAPPVAAAPPSEWDAPASRAPQPQA